MSNTAIYKSAKNCLKYGGQNLPIAEDQSHSERSMIDYIIEDIYFKGRNFATLNKHCPTFTSHYGILGVSRLFAIAKKRFSIIWNSCHVCLEGIDTLLMNYFFVIKRQYKSFLLVKGHCIYFVFLNKSYRRSLKQRVGVILNIKGDGQVFPY